VARGVLLGTQKRGGDVNRSHPKKKEKKNRIKIPGETRLSMVLSVRASSLKDEKLKNPGVSEELDLFSGDAGDHSDGRGGGGVWTSASQDCGSEK